MNQKWRNVIFLTVKNVFKICSFFNFNYGTTYINTISPETKKIPFIEHFDCPKNSTSLKTCKFPSKLLALIKKIQIKLLFSLPKYFTEKRVKWKFSLNVSILIPIFVKGNSF